MTISNLNHIFSKNLNYSPYAALKQAFGYGVRRGALQENPAILIQARDIGGVEKPRDRNLSIHEIKTLFSFLEGGTNRMSLQTKLAIKIILHTGIRSGELRLATWDEIDFNNSQNKMKSCVFTLLNQSKECFTS